MHRCAGGAAGGSGHDATLRRPRRGIPRSPLECRGQRVGQCRVPEREPVRAEHAGHRALAEQDLLGVRRRPPRGSRVAARTTAPGGPPHGPSVRVNSRLVTGFGAHEFTAPGHVVVLQHEPDRGEAGRRCGSTACTAARHPAGRPASSVNSGRSMPSSPPRRDSTCPVRSRTTRAPASRRPLRRGLPVAAQRRRGNPCRSARGLVDSPGRRCRRSTPRPTRSPAPGCRARRRPRPAPRSARPGCSAAPACARGSTAGSPCPRRTG